jgi:hypothetical protein
MGVACGFKLWGLLETAGEREEAERDGWCMAIKICRSYNYIVVLVSQLLLHLQQDTVAAMRRPVSNINDTDKAKHKQTDACICPD